MHEHQSNPRARPLTPPLCLLLPLRHHQQPSGSLLLGPLTESDSGWFLCVATRERERDHRYVYLSVTGAASPVGLSLICKMI